MENKTLKVKILGISASPRHGNTEVLVKAALKGSLSVSDAETEYLNLVGKKINPCLGCDYCIEHNKCVQNDDMNMLYPKLLSADGIIIGSPVYYGTVSGLCKNMLDRMRGIGTKEKHLRLKVGGAIAVGGGKNSGQEFTLLTIHYFFFHNDMIPIGMTSPHGQLGATSSAQNIGDARRDKWRAGRLKRETSAVEMAWMLGRKVALVAKIVKAGLKVTGLDLPDKPYGYSLPEKPYITPEEIK
ncbi:MAG: flavodoxin family protein [Candidatus Bathyarchaeia archaeon]